MATALFPETRPGTAAYIPWKPASPLAALLIESANRVLCDVSEARARSGNQGLQGLEVLCRALRAFQFLSVIVLIECLETLLHIASSRLLWIAPAPRRLDELDLEDLRSLTTRWHHQIGF